MLLSICLCQWVKAQEAVIPEGTARPGYKTTFDRIFVKYMGKEAPFYKDNNKWNRCVIIEVAK